MMIMARDSDYPELVSSLRGSKVAIIACTTCARLCGLGGSEDAGRLSSGLKDDGIDVIGTSCTPAACIEAKVGDSLPEAGTYDTVLAICCSIGARCAGRASGARVVNPVRTYGHGYLRSDGEPVLILPDGELSLERLAERDGTRTGPFQ